MMSYVKVTRHESEDPIDLDIKRFYVPFDVHAPCPKCGSEVVRDLDSDYLSYPYIGIPLEVGMICYDYDMDKECCEFDVKIMLSLTAEPA